MMKTKTALGCRIRKDQYEVLESVAAQFNETPNSFFCPKGERYISTNSNGDVTYMLISNYSTNPPKKKRKFEVPEQLSQIEVFRYDYDGSLGELVIPDVCRSIREVSCVGDKLETLQLPNDLSNLRVLICCGNKLKELHLETATGLEELDFRYNQVSSLYLPQSTPRLSIIRYQNNPLPQDILSKLQRDYPKEIHPVADLLLMALKFQELRK